MILPLIYGWHFYESYKRNGELSLNGLVVDREPIPGWQYPVLVPVVVASGAIIPLLAPFNTYCGKSIFLVVRDI